MATLYSKLELPDLRIEIAVEQPIQFRVFWEVTRARQRLPHRV
jgi:hypothetical protein